MSLEQSIDRLANLVEQLLLRIDTAAARAETPAPSTGKTEVSAPAPTPKAEVKAEPKAEAKVPDAENTTEAPALDYHKDVAPRFSLLVAKDRAAAIAIMRGFKKDAKKLEEALLTPGGNPHRGNMLEALRLINEKLGG